MKGAIRRVRRFVRESDILVRRLLGSRAAWLHCELERLRRCGSHEATTTVLGPPLRLSQARFFEPMYRDIFEREIYKFDAVDAAPRIIDCGANIGMASIYLGRRHPGARITAFEADSDLAALARANLNAFGLGNVEVIAAAVTACGETVHFAATGDLAGRVGRHVTGEVAATRVVPAVRLAPYLEEPIEFLKIDIEGAEASVLASVADRLGNVRRLFVEYHGFSADEQDLPQLLEMLKRSGFRYYVTSACDFRRSPLCDLSTNCGMDLQLNIFCVRPGA
jgi:FkbM family methyltransferase